MNKTITLTPDEVEIVRSSVETVRDDHDYELDLPAGKYPTKSRERKIETVHTAESILKKLEAK